MEKPSDLLTLREAAKVAGLKAVTLRVQIRNGRLKGAVKRGRDWYVTRKALADYMKHVARDG